LSAEFCAFLEKTMDDEEYGEGQCGSCNHSAGLYSTEEDGETVDWCKRLPPVFVGGNPGEMNSWQQPMVRCSDGCSEWAPLVKQQNTDAQGRR